MAATMFGLGPQGCVSEVLRLSFLLASGTFFLLPDGLDSASDLANI